MEPDPNTDRRALKEAFIDEHRSREPDAETKAVWQAACRFRFIDPAADNTLAIVHFGWVNQPELPLEAKEPLLWHIYNCVITIDRVLCETREMKVVFDLRDTSAKNVWGFVNLGVISELTATIDRCFVMPMKSVEVVISSYVIRRVWGGMNKVLLPKYCRDVCSVVNSEAELSIPPDLMVQLTET